MEHIVRKLVGEFVASEDAAREVCEAYWTAVNGNPIQATHQVLDISPMKADAFDPKDRYQTAEGFLTALSFFEDGGHLPTPKPSTAGSETQRARPSVVPNATGYTEPVPLLQSNPYKAKTKGQNLCRKVKRKTAIIGIALLVMLGIGTAVFLGLLNPGGLIAQSQRNRCSIPLVEVILRSGVCIWDIVSYPVVR